jgi:hypothetical protein
MRTQSLTDVLSRLDVEIGKARQRLHDLERARDTVATLKEEAREALPEPLFSVERTKPQGRLTPQPTGQGAGMSDPVKKRTRSVTLEDRRRVRDQIVAIFDTATGPVGIAEIRQTVDLTGFSANALHSMLYELGKTGRIERAGSALYRSTDKEAADVAA